MTLSCHFLSAKMIYSCPNEASHRKTRIMVSGIKLFKCELRMTFILIKALRALCHLATGGRAAPGL
jgi:hypothetical protein